MIADEGERRLRRLRAFERALRAGPSATAVLEAWCRRHLIGAPGRLRADRLVLAPPPCSAARRRRLLLLARAPVGYRRVRLHLDGVVLSEAENWYVPARLTGAMNRALARSDVPFGRVVRALRFRRRTLSRTLLWHGDARTGGMPPRFVLRHHAVLVGPDGTPFSEVVELYTPSVLGPL